MDLKNHDLTINMPNMKICVNCSSPIKVKIPANDGPIEVRINSPKRPKNSSTAKYLQTNVNVSEDMPRISTNTQNSSNISHSDNINPRYNSSYNTHSSISLPEPYRPASLYPPKNNPSNQSYVIPESGFNTSTDLPPPHISPVKLAHPTTNICSSLLDSDYLSSLPHYTFHSEVHPPPINEHIPSSTSLFNTSSIPIINSESVSSSSFSTKDHPLNTYQPMTRSITRNNNINNNIEKDNDDYNSERPSITSNPLPSQPNYSTYSKDQSSNSSSPLPPPTYNISNDVDLPPNLDEIMNRYSPEKNDKNNDINDEFTTNNIIKTYTEELNETISKDENVYIPNNKNYLADLSNSHSNSDNKGEISSSGENSVIITPKDSNTDLELNINNEKPDSSV